MMIRLHIRLIVVSGRFDEKHKEFSDDPRNVRFDLSTDRMNPFNERMSDNST